MAMVDAALAKKLWDTLAPVTKEGPPDPKPSAAIKGYAAGFIKMLSAGLVAHLPGTITAASAPPGGAISGGKADAGKILGLVPALMLAEIAKSNPPVVLAQATLEATAIATYFMTSALVNFPTNGITGNSTATAEKPGPLVGLACQGGKIAGITGPGLASAVQAMMLFTGPKKVPFYTALVDYVMQNAQVSYAAGCVTGVCTNTGQLTGGLGAAGTIA